MEYHAPMRGFDLDQLRTLVAVVDAGSVTAGAPRVFLSQSAASEQLQRLEERVGHVLLQRGRHGVKPTPAGERLLGHARRLIALSDEAWRDLQGTRLEGSLHLAVTDYFRPAALGALLARLNERHPGVRLKVSIVKSGALEAAHTRGEFDIGLVMRIGPQGRSPKPLLSEPLHWVAAPGMRHERGQVLRVVTLSESCSLRQFTLDLLRRRAVPHAVMHEATGVAGLQAALAAGLGVACLNESAIGPSLAPLPSPQGLPALPRVGFHLLPARAHEDDFITRAREVLRDQLLER